MAKRKGRVTVPDLGPLSERANPGTVITGETEQIHLSGVWDALQDEQVPPSGAEVSITPRTPYAESLLRSFHARRLMRVELVIGRDVALEPQTAEQKGKTLTLRWGVSEGEFVQTVRIG